MYLQTGTIFKAFSFLASAGAGGVLFAAPEYVARGSREAAAVVWFAGPLILGHLIGRWLPDARVPLVITAGLAPLAMTVVDLLKLRSHIWPLAFAPLAFWIGSIYLASEIAFRRKHAAGPK